MQTTRRDFLRAGAMTSAALAVGMNGLNSSVTGAEQAAASGEAKPYKTHLYKALIGNVSEGYCEKLQAAGYDGFETSKWNVSIEEARAGRVIAEKYGLRIHSVMRGWASFNNTDAEARQKTIEDTKLALRTASAYGADAMLLVPCRIDVKPMPEAWDFDIDFDPKTLEVKSVAKDSADYSAYIAAQNAATRMSIAAIEELIPLAAKVGVRIALENVWNNLWCTPAFFAAFVKFFDNPWVGSYFDLGNHTKYSRAEAWIEALGSTMVKLHIKGYKVNEVKNELGGGPGEWTAIDKGSIDWKSVRRAIDAANYNGYVSVEEGHYDPAGYAKILDTFFNE